ncbi:glycerophosphodiester phosphodiesterase family protein [Altererythrobacter sp. ZODW24]|uniref:glycerophosphodiester phosphodiesterase family protein n=1 Tax=Altererythrobacter sp. ZODW24 TaxID=2185142 RepID=UPI000DF83A50|nr:glycerophosphodiester phosphodiesterase family protein [Altererythrobacter sp. ZODW24]
MQLSLSVPDDRRDAVTRSGSGLSWLSEWQYAHRGLHGVGVPENSPSAFAGAIRKHMGIECDIQRSRDGRAMVFHDWELDRLTGSTGPVLAKTSDELGRIGLSDGDDTIPTLRRTLDQIGGRVPLLIEIKSKKGAKVSPLCLPVRRALEGYEGQHAIMSFDPRVSRWFADHSPHTPRGLVVTEESERGLIGQIRRSLAFRHAKPQFLAYDIRDLPSSFAAAKRKAGYPILTWTVRSTELRLRAAEHADAPIAEGVGVA